MTTSVVRSAQAELVRERVLDAVSELIGTGGDITFTKVAAAAAVPERTVYRHFPNRQALISALFEHVNRRIGFDGDPPTTRESMVAMVRRVYPGFDTVAPVVDELLSSTEGRQARLGKLEERRAAAMAVVAGARPDLDGATARNLAAVVQVLGTAAVWQALRDFWDLDGAQAAVAVTTAIDALLDSLGQPVTEGSGMDLLAGLNHVAVLTADLDRFVEFYSDVFDLEVVFVESTPAFRHAILRTGPTSWLHPAEVDGNNFGTASPDMFQRGHLDHLALTASSPAAFEALRDRLVTHGATDGTIEDLGAFQSLWFDDPDGMRGELVVIVDDRLGGIHAPRPIQ
jgi:catechol 2,3-dioxygenase-like lactoylglutathione lyase family enzyme/AcrR family transcriptional regulator